MPKSTPKRVVFISSFLPRKCGIATFTSDLISSTATAAKGEFEPLVVAMHSGDQKYDDPVKFEIHQDVKSDYICAADYINFSHVDLVCVQHEFGLFGGEGGSYLSLLLNRLKAPVITTLHTVLDEPDPAYHKSLIDVCNASHKIITMNERGVTMLRDIYNIPGRKIKLIAHGIPDLPFVDSNYYKHKFGMEDRRTILTFGLLSTNKGIDIMLQAMPAIIKADPSVMYIVLGMTHPNILKCEGESYRFSLQQMVKDLGLEEHVIFHNRFVNDQELHNFLCAADVYESTLSAAETISNIEVPEPSLEHLIKLTDDTGLYQHAKFTIPNREYGYCTDDNARGVIAMTRYYTQYPEPKALKFLDTYLSFIIHSQNGDGTVRNMMSFDRSWYKKEAKSDAFGRVLWAFGTVMAQPPTPAYISVIKDCFDKSVEHIQKQLPKGMAYSILGMCDYLKQFPGASDIKRQLELAAEGLVIQYEENHYPDWQWFEDALTYDNAVLPHAMYVAGLTCDNKKYLAVAEKTCEFLLANIFHGKHFSFIGCNGWYERGGTRASFDQQPIEAAGTVMMLRAAYDATKSDRFLALQRKAFEWFLGRNDLHIPLYDFRTKGCNDGLMRDGVNLNQGAESTLSFLLSLLAIVESFAIIGKIKGEKDILLHQADLIENAAQKPTSVKSISIKLAQKEFKKDQIEELT